MTDIPEQEGRSEEGTEAANNDFQKAENGDGAADELRAAQEQLKEQNDRNLRLLAEFDNFKKRAMKERSELLKYQGEQIFVDLLDVLDNLELALGYTNADHEKLKAGLEMIHKMFLEKLSRWEVRPEVGMGQGFDPVKHNAISQVKDPNAKPGTIVGELKKTYFYKDKLIRPGEVVVAVNENN